MKARQPIRWRHYLYPEIGGRIARRTWVEFRFPFIHWLHYMTFGWTTRRLFAVTLVGVVPMAFLFMAGFNIESVSIMFPLVAAILAAVVMGWLLRPRVQFSADIPPRVERGRRFAVRYEVRNTSRRPAVDLDVGVMRFPILTEEGIGAARVPMLPAGASCIVESTGVGHYRGLYRLPPLRCHTEFPSGLWRWGRTDWSERHLSVYPSYTRLQSLDLPEGARNRIDIDSASQLTRSALEFHGCREFRQGDSLRHVHARSSARIGAPVIKEFQAEGRGRTAIVVDTWRLRLMPEMGFFSDPVTEAALSLAAAVTDHLAQSDRELELLVAGPGVHRFKSAGRGGFIDEVLDILAAVETSGRDTLQQLAPVLVDEIQSIASVCMILVRWDKPRSDLARTLEAHGVGVKIVLVTPPKCRRPVDLPQDAVCVDCRAVERGEAVTL